MKEIVVSKVELDELWTFVKKQVPRMEAYEDDGTWVWVGFASESCLVVAHALGERKWYMIDAALCF
ncbi:hypothetical protein [Candidatus Methanocrinis natronophilus]|uniref:Uncharacterized protein n=1 Tax=Candidatus Methanocrinis natronophilus TaxID=3033396 RepID=A0ABT5XB31_9EURY|nr:hypothetical protein [Candidatus Methanocrinis natronophilus]MDF0591919.1 hypothetical protein [Candidatus Methanocrinis natronophilus]